MQLLIVQLWKHCVNRKFYRKLGGEQSAGQKDVPFVPFPKVSHMISRDLNDLNDLPPAP